MRPKRSLGQNFLVDPNYRRKVVDAAGAEEVDAVLEIGPGKGAITEGLLERAKRLVVVEKDPELAAHWVARADEEPRLTAVTGDVLQVSLSQWVDLPRSAVVGNIPYNVTTPIIFHLLAAPRPRHIVLMVQREVAERITATPASADYGALSVGVQTVARAHVLFRVPATAFRPRPRVESAVIRIDPLPTEGERAGQEASIRHVTRAAFQWRRKQLGKILRDHPDLAMGSRAEGVLEALGLDPACRPEALSPEQFIALGAALAEASGSSRDAEPPQRRSD